MNKTVIAIQDFESIKKGDIISISVEGHFLYGGYLLGYSYINPPVKIPKAFCRGIN